MRKALSTLMLTLAAYSVLAILSATPAHAANLTLPSAGVVSTEYISSDAAFINDLSVLSPTNRFLFNTQTTRRGATVVLGARAAGTAFEFQMLARTGSATYTWSSDPADNSDGMDHVRTTLVAANTWLLEWEDLPDLGDQDFNDAVMLVRIGGDTDGDGLWDVWETSGVDADWNGTIDLPIHQAPFNANPNHKDVFLEIDWMQDAVHSHQPKAGVVNNVVTAFANAPVGNPDGTNGITLHVDVSNSIAHSDHMRLDAPTGVTDFDTLKTANFADARRSVYHYCIFAHDLGMAKYYSGLAELPGNDFIVSLGEWHTGQGDIDGDGLADEDVGTVAEQRGTLMHELGHNLDLKHGGGDHTGYKPNFLSIMNYFFQMTGIPPSNTLDYSDSVLASLDENSLDEFLGIQDGTDSTLWFTEPPSSTKPLGVRRQGQGTGPIDWDWDGTTEGASGGSSNVSFDINGDGSRTILTGWSDWPNVKYLFTDTTDFEDGSHFSVDHQEMDYELSVLLREPVADSGGPYVGDEGASIAFDAGGSSDPNGDSLQYRWDFDGDGVWDTPWSSSPTASYTWNDDFTGTVTVEVSDGLFTSTDTAGVTVYNVAPTVDAGPDQTVYSGDVVSFSGSFTDPGTLDTHVVTWDFGDGSLPVGGLTPTHTYLAAASYTVTLTVTDDDGGSGSDTMVVTVRRIPVPLDIKPGGYPNGVNPANKGLIPVAVINDPSWEPYYIDPALIDPTSAAFGPGGAPAVRWVREDVDGDGDLDLLLFFDTQATGIALGDTSATLNADLFDGRQVAGVDSIWTAPRN